MLNKDAKILIVDDMNAIRTLISKTLTSWGMNQLQLANDGADAWTKLTDAKPPFELIISDLEMPTSDGMDLLKRIRGNEIYRNIPFIMLAAKEEAKVSENKITVQSVKPFNANHLKSCVERFVSIK